MGRDNLRAMCERRRAQDAFRPLVDLFELPTYGNGKNYHRSPRQGNGAGGRRRAGMRARRECDTPRKKWIYEHIKEGLS